MRSARLMLATAALAAGLLPVMGSPASAQPIVELEAACNHSTGQYDVTATFTNNFVDLTATLASPSYGFTTPSGVVSGTPTFSPNPVDPSGTSVATFSGPGNSTEVDVALQIPVPEQQPTHLSGEIPLNGDCVAPSPTTTAQTTTTKVQVAQAAQPRFTG